MSIFDVMKIKLFWGVTAISFIQGCRLAWWTWDFSVVAAFCSGGHFWVRWNKIRNISAPDISQMSGACVNLLISIRILFFLAVVECQSRLKRGTSHMWLVWVLRISGVSMQSGAHGKI